MTRGKRMPTRINPNYKPSRRVAELLATRYPELSIEKVEEFIGHELPEFIMYWEGREDSGAAKANWHSTCLNWMKRVYENKREKQHGSHQPSNGDMFAKALDRMNDERKGDRASTDAAHMRKEPPVYVQSDQVRGGRETSGKESTNSISSRSADRCLAASNKIPAMKPEEAFEQLRKDGIL